MPTCCSIVEVSIASELDHNCHVHGQEDQSTEDLSMVHHRLHLTDTLRIILHTTSQIHERVHLFQPFVICHNLKYFFIILHLALFAAALYEYIYSAVNTAHQLSTRYHQHVMHPSLTPVRLLHINPIISQKILVLRSASLFLRVCEIIMVLKISGRRPQSLRPVDEDRNISTPTSDVK